MADETDRDWHLDKKVPIALLAAIVLQSLGIGWWASDLSGRVTRLEHDSSNFKTEVKSDSRIAATATMDQRDRLIRVEATVTQQAESLRRIESKLDTTLRRDQGP